jgi:hypothetical protein
MEHACHLYLSMIPEALIVSMLTPEEFGVYYAIGTSKKARGEAIFFEIDPSFRDGYFDIEEGIRRCVPHEDGRPKASIYLSVYRALEHVALSAFGKLYLVTKDGRVLDLESTEWTPAEEERLHLYQEIAPVHPLIASSYSPQAFWNLIVRSPTSLLSLPAVCFAELRLGELAQDPEYGSRRDLPYSNIDHLRSCLTELSSKLGHSKMVNRIEGPSFSYRTIETGIFMGNTEGLLYYAMPSREELRAEHYRWWRSASM